MKNSKEVELSLNDILELLINLFGNIDENDELKKDTYLNIVSRLKNLETIFNTLKMYVSNKFEYAIETSEITYMKIVSDLRDRYVKDMYIDKESFVKQSKTATEILQRYSHDIDYFISENPTIVERELQLFKISFLFGRITFILEKYYTCLTSFRFLSDEAFVDGFGKYMVYLEEIVLVCVETKEESRKKDAGPVVKESSFKDDKLFLNFRINRFHFDKENSTYLLDLLLIYPLINGGKFFDIKLIRMNMSGLLSDKLNNNIFNTTRLITTISAFFQAYNSLYTDITKNIEKDTTFELEIFCDSESDSVSELFTSFSLILNSIERIKGVEIVLDDLKKGSIFAKFKIIFKDLVAKEEFKTVLRNGIEIAGKRIGDVSVSETNKNYTEIDKAKLEIENLQKEILASLSIPELRLKNELEIEKDKLENEKIAQEIKLLKLQEEMQKLDYIDKLSGLLAKGILEVDDLRISLNGLPIIIKENGKLEVGNIDQAFSE